MTKKQPQSLTATIFVLTNGWVLYAHEFNDSTPDKIFYSDGGVIRVWGTEHGLGELAMKGPTKSTVLDPHGSGYIARSALLFTISCKTAFDA